MEPKHTLGDRGADLISEFVRRAIAGTGPSSDIQTTLDRARKALVDADAVSLFGLILSTGVGSLLSERYPINDLRKAGLWLLSLSAFLVLLPAWFPPLAQHFEAEPILVRAAIALLAIVPAGLMMGFAFPTGMRAVNAIDTRPTPWFWAINGAAGVLAASAALVVSIAFSIDACLWLAAACYLLLGPVLVALRPQGRIALAT